MTTARGLVGALAIAASLLAPACRLVELRADPAPEVDWLDGVRLEMRAEVVWQVMIADAESDPSLILRVADPATRTLSFSGPPIIGYRPRDPWPDSQDTGRLLTTAWVIDEGEACVLHVRTAFLPWDAEKSPVLSDGSFEIAYLDIFDRAVRSTLSEGGP